MELLPLLFVTPVLILAATSDLRYLRIPNRLSIIALVLFVASCALLSLDEIIARVICANVVFGIGFLLFAFGILGGGDVKLLSALMLFIPTSSLLLFGYVFSISMLMGITIIVLCRAAPLQLGANWVSLQNSNTLPMGISIAMAGIVHLILLTFVV